MAPPFRRLITKPELYRNSHSLQEATIITDRKRILHDLEIENDRVSDLLYEDFNIYQANFDAQEDDSAHQDLRASFIAWFMIFAPEVFPPDLAREIASFIGGSLERDEYPTYGWHNTLHLRAGLYGYSKHEGWLTEALANLSHHNSSLRRYVARTIAPVAHLIPASNELVLESIETNMREHHFFNEYSFLLFRAARGSDEAKLDQLRRWREKFKEHQDYDLISSLTGEDPVPNPYAPQFRRVERYILLRLCSKPTALPIQRLARVGSSGVSDSMARIDADQVLARVETHALASTFVIPLLDVSTLGATVHST